MGMLLRLVAAHLEVHGMCCLLFPESTPVNTHIIYNNNNSVHLSCAHQCPERSHDTYILCNQSMLM